NQTKNKSLTEDTFVPKFNQVISSVHQLDSLQTIQPKLSSLEYKFYRKIIQVGGPKAFQTKASNKFSQNIPKALLFYLPIFTFLLWLLHNKKKWWFFDHAIFTLHYFSFF